MQHQDGNQERTENDAIIFRNIPYKVKMHLSESLFCLFSITNIINLFKEKQHSE